MRALSMRSKTVLVGLALGTSLALIGCPEKEGPAEKAGEAVDEAVGDTKRAVEDATD